MATLQEKQVEMLARNLSINRQQAQQVHPRTFVARINKPRLRKTKREACVQAFKKFEPTGYNATEITTRKESTSYHPRSGLVAEHKELFEAEDCREYFACPMPSDYGALIVVEKVLREYDQECYETLISEVPFTDIKVGNPTRIVYGDLYNAYTSAAAKDLRKYNPQEKLKAVLRSRIAMAMRHIRKQRNDPTLKKAGSAVDCLGCTLAFLQEYLEERFSEEMTWDNYGEWEIDHIFPLSKLDLTNPQDFAKACHYSNLQPLWSEDNLKKSNKV